MAKSPTDDRALMEDMYEYFGQMSDDLGIEERGVSGDEKQFTLLQVQEARTDICRFAEIVFGFLLSQFHRDLLKLAIQPGGRLVVRVPVEHGKTTLLSIVVPLWLIGRDQGVRCLLGSSTIDNAERASRTIKGIIEGADEFEHIHLLYSEVFPEVRPSEAKWTNTKMLVHREQAEGSLKRGDYTVQAAGDIGRVTGTRLNYVCFDDVLEERNTRTKNGRDSTFNWITRVVLSRLVPLGVFIMPGIPWHEDDAGSRFLKRPGWFPYDFPACVAARDPDGRIIPKESSFTNIAFPAQDICVHPACDTKNCQEESHRPEYGWTPKRFLHALLTDYGDAEFTRQLLIELPGSALGGYNELWWHKAYVLGQFYQRMNHIDRTDDHPLLPKGAEVVHGVDIATGEHVSIGDETAIVTCAKLKRHHSGADKIILDVVYGNWQAEEILENVAGQVLKWGGLMVVENNAAQRLLIQTLNMRPVQEAFGLNQQIVDRQIVGRMTTAEKHDPFLGLRGLVPQVGGGEWMAMVESDDKKATDPIRKLVADACGYNHTGHPPDLLMAWWIATTQMRGGTHRAVHVDAGGSGESEADRLRRLYGHGAREQFQPLNISLESEW